jgi:hypothetical protein
MEPIEGDRDLMKEVLKAMPNNRGVSLQQAGDDMQVHTVTPEDLKKLGDDPSLFHVIFMFDRPGANYFANYLEFTYFPPDGPLNKELQYRAYRWHDMLWAIISIPVEKQQLCYETAEITKMRLANGLPCMLGAGPVTGLGATRATNGLVCTKERVENKTQDTLKIIKSKSYGRNTKKGASNE